MVLVKVEESSGDTVVENFTHDRVAIIDFLREVIGTSVLVVLVILFVLDDLLDDFDLRRRAVKNKLSILELEALNDVVLDLGTEVIVRIGLEQAWNPSMMTKR